MEKTGPSENPVFFFGFFFQRRRRAESNVCSARGLYSSAAPPETPVDLSCTLKGKPTKIYRLIYGVQLGAVTAEGKHRTLGSTVDAVKRHLWSGAILITANTGGHL